MASAQAVAQFFIGLANDQANCDQGDLMTNLRLQKLLYYAQGWYLARYGRPLFPEEIEAWKLGPVVRTVYNTYKANGKRGLEGSMPSADSFTDEEYALLLDVAREYERIGTPRLIDMSHRPGSPWAKVKERSVIGKDLIRSYFASQKQLKTFRDDGKGAYTPKRDADGIAIIPSDIAEGWDADD